MGPVALEVERRLRAALAPSRLVIRDDSAAHHGHAGHRPEGETHFQVDITSPKFAGLSRLERQRLVHAALADLLRERIHALSIRAVADGEPSVG